MEKTKPNTTKARIHQSKEMYYNTNYIHKNKDRFSRLLRHPAWKRSGSILKGERLVREEISKEKVEKKNKWESIRYKQANKSVEIKNRMKGALPA